MSVLQKMSSAEAIALEDKFGAHNYHPLPVVLSKGKGVFVWDVDEAIGHLINPTLDLSAELQDGEEGCLSFPALSYETPRAFRAVAKGFNMHGEPIIIEGTELLARCLQHETDHLNGVLFIDRMESEQRKLAMKEIRESEWFGIASENGLNPSIKVSPHTTFGLGF